MSHVICFSAQLSNGKDVAADYLTKRLKHMFPNIAWHRCAFGDGVKKVYMDTMGLDREFVEHWKRIDDLPPGLNKNVRQSLQFIGDGFRQMRPNIWVDFLFRQYADKNICISDGRYFSECQAVKDHQGVNVGMWRPGFENDIDHPSESQLKPAIDKLKSRQADGPVTITDSPFDWFLVNEGTVNDLYKKIDEQLLPFILERFNLAAISSGPEPSVAAG